MSIKTKHGYEYRKFTVTIEVSENWILDGFSFEPERIQHIIRNGMEDELPYAYGDEISVTVKEVK